jgi:hypothetical protein
MGLWVGQWNVGISEPADIFDAIGLDARGLLERLDCKLSALAGGCSAESRRFRRWLSVSRNFASAIAFHGGELVSDSCEWLSAKVIAPRDENLQSLRLLNQKLGSDFLDVEILKWDDVCLSTLKGDNSMLRSYFSSELLMMFTNERQAGQWGRHGAMAKVVFDMHPLEDLSWLIAHDVKTDLVKDPNVFDEVERVGKREIRKKSVSLSDFTRSATRAMRMRRVSGDVHKPLMEKAKARLSHGL